MEQINEALKEGMTNIIAEALDAGHLPPPAALEGVLSDVNHHLCPYCEEPRIDRAPYRHIASGSTNCKESGMSTNLTKEEANLFEAIRNAFMQSWMGIGGPHIGLARATYQGKDVAVIVGLEDDGNDHNAYPIAIFVNHEIIKDLKPSDDSVIILPPADASELLAALGMISD